ncbi:hypothetical protein INT47_000889 [Mucor saturninus]|uniref:Uncharacterized protein n=1 Tax=Mucor saturninus TaxID=64648 RepID=A0A8H7RRA5_9FUNG|nr:hypothetical protein INT47_000889 [Mucor saturninus]
MGYPKGNICICPDIYIDTFRREREYRVLNTTQENLKVIKTQNIIPSTEMLQLLNNYVPAMETLVCGYDSPYDAPLVDVALLDLTKSRKLSLIIIDIQFLCVDSPDVCYIEMEYSSKDCSYYLLEMNDNGLALNSVTIENIEEQSNKDGAIILSILIKCHIHVHFKFYCEYTRVADIINGELIQKNEVSYDSFVLFKL